MTAKEFQDNNPDYPFLSFCIDFVEKYRDLTDGEYTSSDGKYCIFRNRFPNELGSPTVNHISHQVRIGLDIDEFTHSGVLFALVWCFIKIKDISISDVEIDKEAVELLLGLPEFSPKGLMKDFRKFFGEKTNYDAQLKRMTSLIDTIAKSESIPPYHLGGNYIHPLKNNN